MRTLLFPGRHIVNTRFQQEYVRLLLDGLNDEEAQRLLHNIPDDFDASESIDRVVFAITSANQEHSRYNPVAFEHRVLGVDRFARDVLEQSSARHRIVGIPHYPQTLDFAHITLKEIAEATFHELELTPQDTLVLSSTPEVIAQYAQLGFAIAPAEYSLEAGVYHSITPIKVVKSIVAAGEEWLKREEIARELAPATRTLWEQFSEITHKVFWLYQDPLLTEHGSLTEARDYDVYTQAMSNAQIIDLKYGDIRKFITPGGKLVDEGCADGALLERVAQEFGDIDLLGIEITADCLARCEERQRSGAFGKSFVHFHQRNLMEKIFEDASIDTTICNSTTHELWSYGNQEETLQEYFALKYAQLRRGGRIIIRDVVGPENGEQEVYLWCCEEDGGNEGTYLDCSSQEELTQHIEGLSTAARFRRFSRDFLSEMRSLGKSGREGIAYREENISGKRYFVTSLRNAVEFMTKKDYADNWESEMNEEFAFWNFSSASKMLEEAGFVVHPESSVYRNEWIAQNRWEGKVELYQAVSGVLEPIKFPVTTMILVGEK